MTSKDSRQQNAERRLRNGTMTQAQRDKLRAERFFRILVLAIAAMLALVGIVHLGKWLVEPVCPTEYSSYE